MDEALPQQRWAWAKILALAAAFLVTGVLFLLVPFTQVLGELDDEMVTYRKTRIVPPPPPFTPPPEEIERVVREAPPPPQLKRQRVEAPVKRLSLSLTPGLGVSLAMGVPSIEGMGMMDLVADIERIFNFDELAKVPTLLNAEMIRADFPRELARRGVREAKAVVEILIDQRGRVKVDRVLSISNDHPRLREAARRAASQARFSITRIEGRAVSVRGRLPISLRASR